jgi:plastocyanin
VRRLVAFALTGAALSLMLTACGSESNPSVSGSAPSGPASTAFTIVAKNTAFDQTTLKAPAGKELTFTFRNEDAIGHSFHLFGGSNGDAKTDIKTGPSDQTVKITLHAAASYQYQCDVHPALMKGTLVVVKS